jgi:hypothetical protein
MKRLLAWAFVVLATALMAYPAAAYAQVTFKILFKFQAGDKKLPAGEYWVSRSGEGQLLFRQVSTGKDFQIPFKDKLSPPTPPVLELRLVFDEVGDFEPSYTEYFTVYVLSEVWLSAKDGFAIHTTKGAHQHKSVTGIKAHIRIVENILSKLR